MDPFGHTGYVPGRRKDIKVGVVGKNRIMKYIQTGFQHLIQRIDTSKCKLEFTVPVRISVKGLLYLVEDLRKRKGSLNVKDPAAFGKAGKITGAHHYKCDVLVSQEAFGKRIAEDKIKVAWLQQGSCLIYAKTIQRQGVFTAEDGNILFFLIWRLRWKPVCGLFTKCSLLFKIFPPIHKSLVFIGNYNILDGK